MNAHFQQGFFGALLCVMLLVCVYFLGATALSEAYNEGFTCGRYSAACLHKWQEQKP